MWLSAADGSNAIALSTDGSEKDRIKYGTASWVYGEELAQTTAMWWSPDSRKVGYYRFDEKPVLDFYLQMNQTQVQDTLDIEAYPKGRRAEPDRRRARLRRRDEEDDEDRRARRQAVRQHGRRPLRLQRRLVARRQRHAAEPGESAAADRRVRRVRPATGKCRVVVHEEWPTGWIENRPEMRFLKDGKRFIWESERNGWKNFYLYDLTGKLIAPLTNDDARGRQHRHGRRGAQPPVLHGARRRQLHEAAAAPRRPRRQGRLRLTDPTFTHTVSLAAISPDNKYFVDVYQTHDTPPATRLIDATAQVVGELAKSDTSKFDQLGLKKVEMFTYTAADGKTTLYGQIQFPVELRSVEEVSDAGGRLRRSGVRAAFRPRTSPAQRDDRVRIPRPPADSRAVPGMGKRTLDADLPEARPGRDGRHGRRASRRCGAGRTSTRRASASTARRTAATRRAMEILRHPEVFAAASASSPPTDWRNYDTIYTERYMWIPEGEQGRLRRRQRR